MPCALQVEQLTKQSSYVLFVSLPAATFSPTAAERVVSDARLLLLSALSIHVTTSASLQMFFALIRREK